MSELTPEQKQWLDEHFIPGFRAALLQTLGHVAPVSTPVETPAAAETPPCPTCGRNADVVSAVVAHTAQWFCKFRDRWFTPTPAPDARDAEIAALRACVRAADWLRGLANARAKYLAYQPDAGEMAHAWRTRLDAYDAARAAVSEKATDGPDEEQHNADA